MLTAGHSPLTVTSLPFSSSPSLHEKTSRKTLALIQKDRTTCRWRQRNFLCYEVEPTFLEATMLMSMLHQRQLNDSNRELAATLTNKYTWPFSGHPLFTWEINWVVPLNSLTARKISDTGNYPWEDAFAACWMVKTKKQLHDQSRRNAARPKRTTGSKGHALTLFVGVYGFWPAGVLGCKKEL